MTRRAASILLCAACLGCLAGAQNPDVIYDEARVPQYSLPDLLVMKSGERVRDAQTWINRRRPEILELYRSEVYGRSPGKPAGLAFDVGAPDKIDKQALDGRAVRKQITISFAAGADTPKMHLLVYLPAGAKKPVPVFLALSFAGNHSVSADPGIALGDRWVRDAASNEMVRQRAPETSRGASAGQWQLDQILQHGYGLATVFYGDIEPDFVGGMKYGVRAALSKSEPAPDEWGAIAAWAWGLSRAMDYLETDHDIDATRVAVMGHSRLGKAAVWAGAQDTRFSIVISNESGEGGAAISRRQYGERTKDLNTRFPHWFDGTFRKYNDHEEQMPFDSHMLLALIAPRALYVASAEEDRWSDPRGEFLGAVHAGPVYELLGKKGIGTDTMPALNQPVGQTVMYHIRTGRHDVTAFDWQQYLAFAGRTWSP